MASEGPRGHQDVPREVQEAPHEGPGRPNGRILHVKRGFLAYPFPWISERSNSPRGAQGRPRTA
eukprot:5297664-Pyramimonas_sp.AAC.1